jgi:hypothetical protein
MIKLEFTVEEVNQILSILGRQPFAEVNSIIRNIVEQGQPQVPAEEETATAE